MAPHEAQAQRNHGQTLTRLAERGGLSLPEMVAIIRDQHWRTVLGLADKAAREILRPMGLED